MARCYICDADNARRAGRDDKPICSECFTEVGVALFELSNPWDFGHEDVITRLEHIHEEIKIEEEEEEYEDEDTDPRHRD